jgi:LmbE family N-acetylglucosaminyl deacetylase
MSLIVSLMPHISSHIMSQAVVTEFGSRVLFVGAHPDDIEIGCGGTAARLSAEGHTIGFAIASFTGSDREREAKEAASKLSLQENTGNLFFSQIPETTLMDKTVALRAWLNEVSKKFQPDTVFIHRYDGHTDHQAVNTVALGCFLRHGIYEYFIPRTEPEPPFTPTKFIDIEDWIGVKVEMCGCHKSQQVKHKYIDEDVVRTTAHYFYQRCDALQSPEKKGYVEAFVTIRSFTRSYPGEMELKRSLPQSKSVIQRAPTGGVGLFLSISRLLRRIGAEQFVGKVRRRGALSYLTYFHEDVIHQMRKLALACEHCGASAAWDDAALEVIGPAATGFCSACRRIFCDLAEVEDNQIHCCLKSINAPTQVVETWARSEPIDYRDESLSHPISQNTVWSALLGRNDGHRTWSLFNCFSSNDLLKYNQQFKNTRTDWQKHYKSALVFPLRYTSPQSVSLFETFGFLALDSKKIGAFKGMPEIFEHIEDKDVYQDKARNCAMFQAGAAIADILSMFLRPICIREPQNK